MHFAYAALTLSGGPSHALPLCTCFLTSRVIPVRPYNPTLGGLDSSAFARRYLRNHYCFLFPGYLDGSLHPV